MKKAVSYVIDETIQRKAKIKSALIKKTLSAYVENLIEIDTRDIQLNNNGFVR